MWSNSAVLTFRQIFPHRLINHPWDVVPWCNGYHSGLWIHWSEFKSRWNLILWQICCSTNSYDIIGICTVHRVLQMCAMSCKSKTLLESCRSSLPLPVIGRRQRWCPHTPMLHPCSQTSKGRQLAAANHGYPKIHLFSVHPFCCRRWCGPRNGHRKNI